MYLETPSVQVIQPADDSAVAMARQVMRLLIGGSGWVRVHSSATGLSSIYTVLDRRDDGYPNHVAYEDQWGNPGTVSL
jgi:hypothetical protein